MEDFSIKIMTKAFFFEFNICLIYSFYNWWLIVETEESLKSVLPLFILK